MTDNTRCQQFTARNNKLAGKPNEDYILADPDAGIYIILDGVSRDGQPYPVPSPSTAASQACAEAIRRVVKHASSGADPADTLRAAVAAGNAAVGALNRDYVGDFAPGTCGIAAMIEGNRLHFAQIGDCAGMVLDGEGAFYFTFDFIQPLRQYQRNRRYYGLDKHTVRRELCNNPRSLLGYGVLDGNPAADAFVKTHSIPLAAGSRVILHTDGLETWAKHMLSAGNLAALRSMTAEEMVAASVTLDAEQGRLHDDTSAIIIDF